MNTGKMIFSQLMDFIPWYEFQKCVQRYSGNYRIKTFFCQDQFRCMAFAQLTFRESLRDIEVCLRSMQNKLYHMGIHGKISKSTLADANNTRDWRIYADFAQVLIHSARDLYSNDDFGLDLEETVYALDSTTIDLCLSLFPWAKFRTTKAGIKMHTLLDLRGPIPSFVEITPANVHDVNILDILIPEIGAFYIMDRGYIDYEKLYQFHQWLAYFIIRAKDNLNAVRVYSHPVDKSTGLRSDQTIRLKNYYALKNYPEYLRRVCFFDLEHGQYYVFLTNNFSLPALTIAQAYKQRWKIEIFFKWIKQHLRIKSFFGTSQNAVKSQIWIAISIYVLIAIVKKRLKLECTLYTFLQILSVTIFEKIDISRLETKTDNINDFADSRNQLELFN
ncbi:MAG TPA: IS4 family transposase [Candidatus Marinimicrobia bacterium]|nr:IS4 family transposase [Candidatus Neomarinimicrobiota bacterium]